MCAQMKAQPIRYITVRKIVVNETNGSLDQGMVANQTANIKASVSANGLNLSLLKVFHTLESDVLTTSNNTNPNPSAPWVTAMPTGSSGTAAPRNKAAIDNILSLYLLMVEKKEGVGSIYSSLYKVR